jgi:hypothetical protein
MPGGRGGDKVAGGWCDAPFSVAPGDRSEASSLSVTPGDWSEAEGDPGPIGRRIVWRGPVLALARVGAAEPSAETGRTAQWVPARRSLRSLGRDDGVVVRPRRLDPGGV